MQSVPGVLAEKGPSQGKACLFCVVCLLVFQSKEDQLLSIKHTLIIHAHPALPLHLALLLTQLSLVLFYTVTIHISCITNCNCTMTSFFLYCAAILPSWLAVLGTVIIVGDLALFPYPIPKNDLKKTWGGEWLQFQSAFQSSNLIGWVQVYQGWVRVNLRCCQGNGAYACIIY